MLGLIGDYQYAPSDTIAQGLIVSQSPDASEQIPRGGTVTIVISTGPDTSAAAAQSAAGAEDGVVQIQNGADGIWKCDAQLVEPSGYSGQAVRITLVQNGVESTIFEGTTSFPYRLTVQGAAGVDTGTAYIYLLDSASGEVTSKIEYPGISFAKTAG